MADTASDPDLKQTPLHARHAALGARLVPFAGYEMPVQYEGILAEHTWTRENAGLFDVSHMGQAFLAGPDHATTAAALEKLVPGDIAGLKPGRVRYTLLLNDAGGILDDLMVTRSADPNDDGRLYLVVNAANKDADYAVIRGALPADVSLEVAEDRALIAIQGPKAADAMARHCETCGELSFMAASSAEFDGIDCHIGRSGYTGEDGFEISVAADKAVAVWDALVAEDEVKPVGLGARDSLRLEAGLCLHGHDIDAETTPVAADLLFAISKRRREEGGFPGAEKILAEMKNGPAEKTRRPCAGGPRAGPRRRRDRAGRRDRRPRHVRRVWPDRRRAHRHGLRRGKPRRTRHRAGPDGARPGPQGESGRHALRAPALLPQAQIMTSQRTRQDHLTRTNR